MKRTVLITGSSSGIGKATTQLFAKNGWNVIATIRKPSNDQDFAGLGDALVTRLDVQDRDSIGKAIELGIARFSRIDALVSCV